MIKTASELILVWMICASSQGCGDLSRKEKNASSSALIGSSLSPGLKAGKSNSNSDQENRRTVGESVDLERDTVSVFHGDQADRDPGLVHDDNPVDGDVKEAEKKLDVEDPKEEVGSDGSLDGNESESIARGEVRSPSSDEEKSEDNDGPAVGPKGVSDETSDGFQPVSTDSVHNPEQSLLSEDLEKVVARDEGVVSDNNNNEDIEKQDNVEVPEIVKASPALSAKKDKKKGEPVRKGNTRKLGWKHVLGSLGLAAAASLGYWALQNQGAHLADTRTIGNVYTSDKGLSKFDASATDLSKAVAIYRKPQFSATDEGNGVQSYEFSHEEAEVLKLLGLGTSLPNEREHVKGDEGTGSNTDSKKATSPSYIEQEDSGTTRELKDPAGTSGERKSGEERSGDSSFNSAAEAPAGPSTESDDPANHTSTGPTDSGAAARTPLIKSFLIHIGDSGGEFAVQPSYQKASAKVNSEVGMKPGQKLGLNKEIDRTLPPSSARGAYKRVVNSGDSVSFDTTKLGWNTSKGGFRRKQGFYSVSDVEQPELATPKDAFNYENGHSLSENLVMTGRVSNPDGESVLLNHSSAGKPLRESLNKLADAGGYYFNKLSRKKADVSKGQGGDSFEDCSSGALRDCTANGQSGFCCLLSDLGATWIAFSEKASLNNTWYKIFGPARI